MYIIKPIARITYMRPIAAHIARSVVCLRVCVCVGHTEPSKTKNGRIDRYTIWRADSCGPRNLEKGILDKKKYRSPLWGTGATRPLVVTYLRMRALPACPLALQRPRWTSANAAAIGDKAPRCDLLPDYFRHFMFFDRSGILW